MQLNNLDNISQLWHLR